MQLIHFSTKTRPASERFALCRNMYPHMFVYMPATLHPNDFTAETVFYSDDNGFSFSFVSYIDTIADHDTIAKFHDRDVNFVLVGLVLTGSTDIIDRTGAAERVMPWSGLNLLDPSEVFEMRTRSISHLHLVLPRDCIPVSLQRDFPQPHGNVTPLSGLTLAPFLLGQMQLMAQHSRRLAEEAAQITFGVACDLALGCLRELAQRATPVDERRADDAFYSAAIRYIQHHYDNPDLTAGSISAAIGCSRAHLYRAFSAHEETIGQYIRDARHRLARDLLTMRRTRSVADVAVRCGFRSVAAFSRAFRAAEGMTPTKFRCQHEKSLRPTYCT